MKITISPNYKQHLAYQLLHDQSTRFLAFGGGAEGGKSWLGAEWLLTNCYFYPGSKWFIGRNELKRLMQSSYATFRKICQYYSIPDSDWSFNGQYNYIQFTNGSRIDLLDLKYQPSDPMFQRFGSTEYTGGWIEEGGEIHFMAFDVLKSRVGRWMNQEYGLLVPKILITCNPEQNWVYRWFYKPWKMNTLRPGYAFIQALYKDNPHTREQAEKRLDEISDPVLRSRLKLGLWEYAAGENILIQYDAIIDLFTNTLDVPVTGFESTQKKFFTADVARYGSDKVTMGSWRGLDLYQVQWKKKRGIDQTAQDVREILQHEHVPYSHAIVDDDGVGGGVVDLNRGIKGFVGNSTAIVEKGEKQNYKNLRSQCAFKLAEYINTHKIAISAPLDETTKEWIIEELQQIKKKDTPIDAPLQIIPKEEIKDALGRSPDFADMMMMRMYFELKKPVVFKMNTDVGGVKPYIPGTMI